MLMALLTFRKSLKEPPSLNRRCYLSLFITILSLAIIIIHCQIHIGNTYRQSYSNTTLSFIYETSLFSNLEGTGLAF